MRYAGTHIRATRVHAARTERMEALQRRRAGETYACITFLEVQSTMVLLTTVP